MAKTIQSGLATYCSASEFLKRYDTRTVAQLLSDTGIDIANVSTDTTLAAILQEASGKLEAAAQVGERYKPVDLAALASTSTNAQAFLAGIVSDIAITILYRRRPDVTMPRLLQVEESERMLEALANGVRIFGFTETMEVGHMEDYKEQPFDVEARNLQTYQARHWFGRRGNRIGPVRT